MKIVYVLFLAMVLSGCVLPNKLPEIHSGKLANVMIEAQGIKQHIGNIDDVVWLHIYEDELTPDSVRVGQYRLTTEVPYAIIPVDSEKLHMFHLYSIESNFGGYSTCSVLATIDPKVNANLSLVYSTKKTSCNAILKDISDQKKPEILEELDGAIGGVRVVYQPSY